MGGNLVELEAAMDATNALENGGSPHVLKMLFSTRGGYQNGLAIVAYVPSHKIGHVACTEWVNHVLQDLGAERNKCTLSMYGTDATALVPGNALREAGAKDFEQIIISTALNFLRMKGFLQDGDDDEIWLE